MPKFDIKKITNKNQYTKKFLKLKIKDFEKIEVNFGSSIVANNYKIFITKITHYIKSI